MNFLDKSGAILRLSDEDARNQSIIVEISHEQNAEIQRRLSQNDRGALDLIWEVYGDVLYRFLVSRLCSRTEADDVMQELLIKIAQKRNKLAKANNLSAYLFGMARNESVSHIRKNKKREEVPLSDFGLVAAHDSANAFDTARVDRALSSLEPEQREVVVLKFFEAMTFKEIGKNLGVSQNTAASRYRYGMEKLKEHFSRSTSA